MKNTKAIIILAAMLFFMLPSCIKASYDAVITGSAVKLRKDATTSSDSLYSFGVNTNISVVDKTLVKDSGDGCSSDWYKVTYKDITGYVCSKYVSFIDTSFEGINVQDYLARVNANDVNVHESSSSTSKNISTLSLGVNVNILEETNDSNKSCNKMYKIKFNGDKVGYICSEYVTKKTDIILDDNEYAQVLREQKFPESYIPYLSYLHSKYPNWVFNPKETNINFNIAVDSEEGKNYMQTTNNNYRTSSTPAEGSSWFKVNSQVIAFYMDPRNWLTEERIFMFEKQAYNDKFEDSYLKMVKSIFGSGALADDKYTIPIVNSGKNNRISPLFIAARIRLEVGANGSDSTNGTTFTWKGKKYSGYYNFFNIGAYQTTIDGVKYSAIQRGLAYAAKLINRSGSVWNNIEVAITEGSNFLLDSYVNNGQGTLYYQKFNVATSSPFTHQYQTNIQAPVTEGNKIYNAYKTGNLLNEALEFEIPIFLNMPEFTSLPASGDSTNTLKSLSVDGYYMLPGFEKDVTDYEIYVPSSINKINVNAISDSNLSTITGNGEIEITDDNSLITISNTSQTGIEKKYSITIHKVNDNINISTLLSNSSVLLNDNCLTKLKNETTLYNLKLTLIKNGAKEVVITNSGGGSVKDSDILATGYKIKLSTALETKDLIISVNGDTSGDGKITILDLLQIQKHIKNSTKLSGAALYAADTSGDNAITILDLLQVQRHIKKVQSL